MSVEDEQIDQEYRGWIDATGVIYSRARCGIHAVPGPFRSHCPVCSTLPFAEAVKDGRLKPRP
jgi:hypothetical protein